MNVQMEEGSEKDVGGGADEMIYLEYIKPGCRYQVIS